MKYKVSLALYGHNHAVQRLTPAYRNASTSHSVNASRPDGSGFASLFLNPVATLHMVIGTGGAGFSKNCAECGSPPRQKPSWSENVQYKWGCEFGEGWGCVCCVWWVGSGGPPRPQNNPTHPPPSSPPPADLNITAVSATVLYLDWSEGSTGIIAERITLVQDLSQPWADAVPPPSPATPDAEATLTGGAIAGIAAAGVVVMGVFVYRLRLIGIRAAAASQTLAANSDGEKVALVNAGVVV